MKINDHGTPIKFEAIAIKPGDAVGGPASPPRDSADPNGTDRVVLSPRAREHLEARKVLSTIPDIDHPKVDQVRAAVAQGHYRIDANQVAEQMLNAMIVNVSLFL
jgi:negative regulator of flagellin synthesis FlgM